MERINIDKRIIEEVIRYMCNNKYNIYCEVTALIKMIEHDARPVEKPKEEQPESEDIAQA